MEIGGVPEFIILTWPVGGFAGSAPENWTRIVAPAPPLKRAPRDSRETSVGSISRSRSSSSIEAGNAVGAGSEKGHLDLAGGWCIAGGFGAFTGR